MITSRAVNDRADSIVRHSLVNSSITTRIRNCLPSSVRSGRKSLLHTWFRCVARWRTHPLTLPPGNLRRFRCFRGTCMCSSFRIRCNHLKFTRQPPNASGPGRTRCTRSLPYLGNVSTILRITLSNLRSPSTFLGRCRCAPRFWPRTRQTLRSEAFSCPKARRTDSTVRRRRSGRISLGGRHP
jgi:hypothetical protein